MRETSPLYSCFTLVTISQTSDDSDDTASVQEPYVIDHVEVSRLQFNPCVFLTTQVQTMLLIHSHLNDRELYRLITLRACARGKVIGRVVVVVVVVVVSTKIAISRGLGT